jgi:prepilin-type N-terminal cleavage/methylation domain-containing protein
MRCSRARPATLLGYTIIEMLAAMAVIGFLAGFAVPRFRNVSERAKVARAIGDIRSLQADLMALETQGKLPVNLAAIGRGGMTDPWGNPYVYVRFPPGAPPPGARVDRFGVPINTSFDLYSFGPDGSSAVSLVASASLDDITRANDGGYTGEAWKY